MSNYLFHVTFYWLFALQLVYSETVSGQRKEIPADHLMSDKELLYSLNEKTPELKYVTDLRDKGNYAAAVEELTRLLKDKLSTRYYFNWQNINDRLNNYIELYPHARDFHLNSSSNFISIYSSNPRWILPFNNLKGEAVTAYRLRHLARQSRASDVVLSYAMTRNREYLDYVLGHVNSLNAAFAVGEYDDAGNGVYESFRAGKRVHQWLFAHNVFLTGSDYTIAQQALMVKTLLHHGAQLQQRTKKNHYGNHHTKGLVALFEIAALLPEFIDSDTWIDQAIDGLEWHITREINSDGFQFERSVHYHIGDIENYFRVFQLAQRNNIDLPTVFNERVYLMFEALVKLGQPNKRLPVLQDDTDIRFAENNVITDAMLIGTILFNKPLFKYFIEGNVSPERFWLFSDEQLTGIESLSGTLPLFGSTSLPVTGYYTMRNGWEYGSEYLTITAGVSEYKPDHQHGDILGVVAWANGHEILPNYQVKYSFPDYPQWKNSWAKNVALVDSIPLGRQWKGNRGGSGFGKWLELPEPIVHSWQVAHEYDYFLGQHNGYQDIGVEYYRELIFIKTGFWLVRDHFQSKNPHSYQQVWQGSFSADTDASLTKIYADGSGLIIRQLNTSVDYSTQAGRIEPKDHVVVEVSGQTDFIFTSLLIPFADLAELAKIEAGSYYGWEVEVPEKSTILNAVNISSDATVGCGKSLQPYFLFNLTWLKNGSQTVNFSAPVSALLIVIDKHWELQLLGPTTGFLSTNARVKIAGEEFHYPTQEDIHFEPGAIIILKW